MPTYVYKYRRRYGRRYSRYRRYSGAYSRYRRRRSGTSSTASSRGRIRVRVPVQKVVTLTVAAGQIDSNVCTSSPFINVPSLEPLTACAAVQMPLYNAYCNLYDQVKCDGVVTNVSVVSPIGAGAGAAASALQVIVAYDRQGNRMEAINAAPPPALTVVNLFNFSSAVARSAINNSVAKMSRSCWASDLQERTVFHDSTVGSFSNPVSVSDKDYFSNANKLGYFAPLTLIGLRLAAAAPTTAVSIQILLEQVYYFTFRSPKFGGDPTASANTRMSSTPITMDQRSDTRRLDIEGDMDDAGGLDDEAAVAAAPPARVRRSELREDLRQFFPNLPA